MATSKNDKLKKDLETVQKAAKEASSGSLKVLSNNYVDTSKKVASTPVKTKNAKASTGTSTKSETKSTTTSTPTTTSSGSKSTTSTSKTESSKSTTASTSKSGGGSASTTTSDSSKKSLNEKETVSSKLKNAMSKLTEQLNPAKNLNLGKEAEQIKNNKKYAEQEIPTLNYSDIANGTTTPSTTSVKATANGTTDSTPTATTGYSQEQKTADEAVVKEYEGIGEYNILERLFGKGASDKRKGYNRKQELQGDYEAAVSRLSANKVDEYNATAKTPITDDTFFKAFEGADLTKEEENYWNINAKDTNAAHQYIENFTANQQAAALKQLEAAGISEEEARIRYMELADAKNLEETRQFSKDNPVAATISSVVSNYFMSTLGAIARPINYMRGRTNRSDGLMTAVQDSRSAVSEDMGTFGNLAYGAATSVGDMLVSAATGSSAVLALEKANDVYNSAMERGLNADQAITESIASGVTTAATESKVFESLGENLTKGLVVNEGESVIKALGKNMLKNFLLEGGQEVAEGTLDTAADIIIADVFSQENKSEISNTYQDYIDAGYSENEALKQTILNQLQAGISDFIVGGAVGGIMGGVNLGAGVINNGGITQVPNANNVNNVNGVNTEANIEENIAQPIIPTLNSETDNVIDTEAEVIQTVETLVENGVIDENQAQAIETIAESDPKAAAEIINEVTEQTVGNNENVEHIVDDDFSDLVDDEANETVMNYDEGLDDLGNETLTARVEAVDSERGKEAASILNSSMRGATDSIDEDIRSGAINEPNYIQEKAIEIRRAYDSAYTGKNPEDINYDSEWSQMNLRQMEEAVADYIDYKSQEGSQMLEAPEGMTPEEALEYTANPIPELGEIAPASDMSVELSPENIKYYSENDGNAKSITINGKNYSGGVNGVVTAYKNEPGLRNELHNALDMVNQYIATGDTNYLDRARELVLDIDESLVGSKKGKGKGQTEYQYGWLSQKFESMVDKVVTASAVNNFTQNASEETVAAIDTLREIYSPDPNNYVDTFLTYANDVANGKNSWNELMTAANKINADAMENMDKVMKDYSVVRPALNTIIDEAESKYNIAQRTETETDIPTMQQEAPAEVNEAKPEVENNDDTFGLPFVTPGESNESVDNGKTDSGNTDSASEEVNEETSVVPSDFTPEETEMFNSVCEELLPGSLTGDIVDNDNGGFGIQGGKEKVSEFRTNKFNDNLSPEVIAETFHNRQDFTMTSHSEVESYDAGHDFATRATEEQKNALIKKAMQYSDDGQLNSCEQWEIDALMDMATTAEAEGIDNNDTSKLEYANTLFRAVQKQATAHGQALQALAKWKRSTPSGQYTDAMTQMLIEANKRIGGNTIRKAESLTDTILNTVKEVSTDNNADIETQYEEALRKIKEEQEGIEGKAWENIIREALNQANEGTITRDSVLEMLGDNKKVNKEIAELLKDDFATQKKVISLLEEASTFDKNSYEARLRVAQAGSLIGKKIPSTFGGKVREVLYHNMLASFRTVVSRNAGGNAGVNAVNQLVTRPIQTLIDKFVSKYTGKRTETSFVKGDAAAYFNGFASGFADEMRDLSETFKEFGRSFKNKDGFSGIHTGKKGDLDLYEAVKRNSTQIKGDYIPSKIFNLANELIVKHGMSGGDRVFYEAQKAQTLNDLRTLADKNLNIGQLGMDIDPYIEAVATEAALEMCYQNDTQMSDGFTKLANGINSVSQAIVGKDVLTQAYAAFIKTPANVINTNISYSPVGLVRNAVNTAIEISKVAKYKDAGHFDQRRFVKETARGIVGTALMYVAYLSFKNGLISGGYSDDKDEKAAQKARGEQEYALKLGNKEIDLSFMPVIGTAMEAGAAAGEAYDENRAAGKSWLESSLAAAKSGTSTGITSQLDQSYLGSIKDLLGGNYGGSIGENVIQSLISAYTGQFTPAWLRQLAQSTDEYQRDSGKYNTQEYALRSLASNIPVLRENLNDIRYDTYGRPIEQNQGRGVMAKLIENMIFPGKYTEVKEDFIGDEAARLLESTGSNAAFVPSPARADIKDKDGNEPGYAAYNEYCRVLGEYEYSLGMQVMDSKTYGMMSDETKVDALQQVYKAGKAIARSECSDYSEEQVKGVLGKKGMEIYNEYGISGLSAYYTAKYAIEKDGMSVDEAIRNATINKDIQAGLYNVLGSSKTKSTTVTTAEKQAAEEVVSASQYAESVEADINAYKADVGDKKIGGADLIPILDNYDMDNAEKSSYIISNVSDLTEPAKALVSGGNEDYVYSLYEAVKAVDGSATGRYNSRIDSKEVPYFKEYLKSKGYSQKEIDTLLAAIGY